MNKIEVVIINWKRPKNVEKIIFALKKQTIPCTITVCDCHIGYRYSLCGSAINYIDRIYRWKHNLGAFSRYVPMPSFDHEYTFFIDDDLLPGTKCLEGFLESADKLKDFGVLGQLGRIISADGIYRPVDIARNENLIETDFIIRAYFTKTSNLHNLIKFRWHLNYFEEEFMEDDLLLCAALKYYNKLSCFLIPLQDDREYLVNKVELSSQYALSKRYDHYQKRIDFVKRLTSVGWKYINQKNIALNKAS